MKDFYEREIQVGDICAFWDGNHLDSRRIWGCEGDSVIISDYHKTLIKKAKEVIDITAIERQIHSETFLNSIKALDVKPDSTVVASIIPNQISYTEAAKMFDGLKAMFPSNEVSMVMGVDITVEN